METPSLGRRIAALIIDWAVAALSAVALTNVTYPPRNPGENLVIVGFFVVEVALLTGLLGFTIGKRILGLRVENPQGVPIGVPRAIVRTVLLSLVLPAIVMNDDKRGLHDIAAGSRVIRV
ncbi:RDD family protein [Aeromicrobium panaciterrae]|uniref:RDD family protein n=1 Tax=Aeromicrobium panaciterrae TaxID=363861 RepID=UPI0031CE5E5C